MDDIKTFQQEIPTKDHYWIYTNTRTGRLDYYRITMEHLARYKALYGFPVVRWSYTANQADRVCGV